MRIGEGAVEGVITESDGAGAISGGELTETDECETRLSGVLTVSGPLIGVSTPKVLTLRLGLSPDFAEDRRFDMIGMPELDILIGGMNHYCNFVGFLCTKIRNFEFFWMLFGC